MTSRLIVLPPKNEEIFFNSIDRHGNMEATIRYQKSLGFQFKCFVDHEPYEYEKITKLVKASNCLDVSKGEGKQFRIYFIVKEYKQYTTVDGFVNNIFYPY